MNKDDKQLALFFGIPFGLLILALGGSEVYDAIYGIEATNEKIESFITENEFSKARQILPRLADDSELQLNTAEKITRAEITFYVRQDELIRARTVATENKAMHLYQEVYSAEKFPILIAEKNYDEAFNILSTWVFVKEPIYAIHTTGDDADFGWVLTPADEKKKKKDAYKQRKNKESADIRGVDEYNSEMGTYNDNVFKLFYAAIADNNKAYIKRCLLLFQDELEESSREENTEGGYDIKYKKASKALREAKQKLTELKIRL